MLKKLALGYSIAAACRAEKIGRSTFYDWLANDPEFAKKYADAMEDGTDAIEDVARKKAMDGDNTMIGLLLKSRRPDKYRERADVNIGGNVNATVTVVLSERSDGPQ